MKSNKEIRVDNLKLLIKKAGGRKAFTDQPLADTLNISYGYIGLLVNGHSKIGDSVARKLEEIGEKPDYWLDVEHLAINDTSAPYASPGIESNAITGPDIQGVVPLISSVQAGAWTEAFDEYEVGDYKEMRQTTAKVSASAFALRVSGDSMTAPYGQSMPEGMVVIVDPMVEPLNGKIVIAKLDDSNEATIKKLVIDGSQRYLMPLNPRYDKVVINGNCRIVGVVVKGEIDF